MRTSITISRGGLAPVVVLSGLFAMFAPATGLPVALAALLGAFGGTTSLLVHELGHVRAARRVPGIHSATVSLIWLGAATRFEGGYASGREQARVAVGGPKASMTLALTLAACCFAPVPFALKEMLLAVAVFNVVLGVVNLVPAYPLDGYKLVVGLLWSATGSERQAKRIVRRVAVGWAAFEVLAAMVLLAEKPALGVLVIAVAGCWLLQKRLASAAA